AGASPARAQEPGLRVMLFRQLRRSRPQTWIQAWERRCGRWAAVLAMEPLARPRLAPWRPARPRAQVTSPVRLVATRLHGRKVSQLSFAAANHLIAEASGLFD